MTEIWTDIRGYEGIYMVSNFGRVKRLRREKVDSRGRNWVRLERIINGSVGVNGYVCVSLSKNGRTKSYLAHRLVAKAFLVNEKNKRCVNHINEVKTDNRVANLEWATHQENLRHNNLNKRMGLKRINGSSSIPIIQKTPEGNFVSFWKSSEEAGRNGFTQQSVNKCCTGALKSHKGYLFCYVS